MKVKRFFYPAADTRRWASAWLSESRFDSYLRLCGGDSDLALQLHEWNLKLGQSLMGDIAHFELALRNSYDRVLREHFDGSGHWLYDESSPVIRPIMRKIKAKIMRDVKNGRNRFGGFVERARRPRPLRRPNSRHGSGSRMQNRPSEHLNSRPASSPGNFRDCQVRKHPDLHLGYPTNPKQDAHSTDFVMRMDPGRPSGV